MRALIFDKSGDPREVLRPADIAEPQISFGSVLIRVKARPIQPADLAFIRGQYRIRPRFPQTAGLEGSGIVVQADDDRIRVGTPVAFRLPGTWADLAVAPFSRLIVVPEDMSHEVACQMSLNPVTGWALIHESRCSPGDWILVTAATSTVSNIVGAIARKRGIKVIGLVRGDEAAARRRCTADHVLSVDRPSLSADVGQISGERKIQALLDSFGGQLVQRLFATLAPGARIVAYGVQDRSAISVTNATLIYSNLIWKGFGIDRWLEQLDNSEVQKMHEELWSMVRDGSLALPVSSTHTLDEFGDALEADAAHSRTGKVILKTP